MMIQTEASPLMSTPNPGALVLPTQPEGPFPIQRLPLDTLMENFTHCLPEPLKGTLSPLDAPLLLCKICSAWRILAISTPKLWKVLHLYFDFHVPSAEHLVDLIHMWIGRTGALPLIINFGWSNQFHCTRKECNSNRERSLRIYNVLSKYASRWETLSLSLPEAKLSSLPRSDDVPLLRHLFVSDSLLHGFKVPFLSAPRLTTVDTHDLQCRTSEIPTIPWHQLTVLRIFEAPTLLIALDIFKCCPRLEELTIPGIYNHNSLGTFPQAHRPRIEHATLREVSLTGEWLTDSHPFLDSLSMPVLKRLSLRGSGFFPELIELFNHSKCELEALSLFNPGFSPDKLQECLEHNSCKTLTHLWLKNVYSNGIQMVNDKLLFRLTCYGGGAEGPLCPNLKQLTFKSWCSKGTTPGLLGGMVLSRCVGRAGVKQLQMLDFTPPFPLPEEDAEFLKCAVLNGLRFSSVTTD